LNYLKKIENSAGRAKDKASFRAQECCICIILLRDMAEGIKYSGSGRRGLG